MYLFINEDGSMYTATEFTDSDAEAANAGIIDVVNLQGASPTRYINGVWEKIEEQSCFAH